MSKEELEKAKKIRKSRELKNILAYELDDLLKKIKTLKKARDIRRMRI